MSAKPLNILVCNDDGVESPGIRSLAEALRPLGQITVVAPNRERSTSGHSLTLHKPLRILNLGDGFFATTGTPADCIYLGIREILKKAPDVIVSGINAGANLGTDIHYSGTVAAAREGALMNIRSYAFSVADIPKSEGPYEKRTFRFEAAAKIARKILEETIGTPFPSHTLLNVNIPNRETVRGWKVSKQGFRYYANEVTKRADPRGRDYYWIGGPYLGFEKGGQCDCHAVEEGWVSITPITIDCTHNEFYATLQKVFQ